MIRKICLFCKKEFPAPHNGRKYCSGTCSAKRRTGKFNSNWRHGYTIRDGYKYVLQPNHPFATKSGQILEHRLIMEKILGRFLNPKEVVHHINHNKLDNRPKNLMLCKSTGKHTASHHPNSLLNARNNIQRIGTLNPNYRHGKYCKPIKLLS